MMNIGIYGRSFNDSQASFVEHFFNVLDKHKCKYVVYRPFFDFMVSRLKLSHRKINTFLTHSEIKDQIDFLFSIGGDGSLLDTISLVRDSDIPIMGINTGRLGFLASISMGDMENTVENLAKGHYSLDKRSLLRLESNEPLFGEVNYALNELTVHKKDSSSMMIIHAYLNGEFLNSYWADGLIIATPTGSTGYSLSCGGPIIIPQSENFVITPVAPHNLNVRPIIVSDKSVISLEIEGRSPYFLATLDSRSVTINPSVQLAVRKEDFSVNLIRMNNENFLNTLRNKLMWGLDSRN